MNQWRSCEFHLQLENGVIIRTSTGYKAIANNGSSEFFSATSGFDPLRDAVDFINEEVNKNGNCKRDYFELFWRMGDHCLDCSSSKARVLNNVL